MWASLITLVPVGLVLGLLTFGRYAGRTPAPVTPGRVVPVAAVAVVMGPVAVSALGFFAWLLVVMIVVAAGLMVATLRTPPLQH
jgi:phosphatidylserine synthase